MVPRPLPMTPTSMEVVLEQPRHTHRSDFTGLTQQVRVLSPYWRGRVVFPSMNREDTLRPWRAFLGGISQDTDPSFWIPYYDLRKESDLPTEWKDILRSLTTDIGENADYRLYVPQPPPAVGTTIQIRLKSAPNISFCRVVTAAESVPDANGGYDMYLNASLPSRLRVTDMEYTENKPMIRAIATGTDMFGANLAPAGIHRPLVLEWVEALGVIANELDELLDTTAARGNEYYILAENGDRLMAQNGDLLVFEEHNIDDGVDHILTQNLDILTTEHGERLLA